MEIDYLTNILKKYKDNKIKLEDVLKELRRLPYEDLGFAKVDHHRALRQGFPEVVFCRGKTAEQVVKIFQSMFKYNRNIMGTKASRDIFEAVRAFYPQAKYHETAKIISLTSEKVKKSRQKILVITAGSSDIPVAEEAAVTAEIMGHLIERIYDVGISGIHRLFAYYEELQSAAAIIVVAGMEGALPGVVGGLTSMPVIAVPTSVGYGANFNGLSALLAMLNSCASGIGVVNIDNGFGAAAFADAIIRSGQKTVPLPE
ncbi:MAG: nickel pincer cofactor biosynthesis protein LarB [Firmicutes bacterium]|nr:nickel pincer cofactor biosynthesis protein LarB [Bacillota bacterium]